MARTPRTIRPTKKPPKTTKHPADDRMLSRDGPRGTVQQPDPDADALTTTPIGSLAELPEGG